jgi:hypothetical protein
MLIKFIILMENHLKRGKWKQEIADYNDVTMKISV